MSDESPDPVQALFDRVVELPPGEREAFLDNACHGNARLRADLESLLAYDRHTPTNVPDGLLRSPLIREPERTSAEGPQFPSGQALPERIGHYRILCCIGEGGMGTVYEAEQENPRRQVALKVIRPGLLSPALLKRFGQEGQILGRLHHTGIAQIYEAGTAEDGRQFFAMEFIRGLTLDEYVRRHKLDARARIGLLGKVCDAVQHAHDQGIIHRDLKPGNILVDETGQPKVLDFGVARATDADLQMTTARTEAGQLLGTLSYMSPEQVTGDPAQVDRRSDVYALGVILFELLAERLPYHLQHLPLPEVARVIREQEPSRLGSINSVCRGDVEAIVGKALEKERERRYASAAALSADIRRYLNHEPILARPPSAVYQLRKFARRHKALVSGVLAVMVALVLGLVGTLLFAVKAGRNAQTASDKEQESRYQTYRARIAAAGAALVGHDVTDAARQLSEAPEELRGWEWRHLHSRLDDSSAMFPVGSAEILHLVHSPEGVRVAAFTGNHARLLDPEGHELLSWSFPVPSVWVSLDLLSSTQPRVVTLVAGGTIHIVDKEGRIRSRLKGLVGFRPRPGSFSHDGSRLAVGWSEDNGWAVTFYQPSADEQSMIRVNPGCSTHSLAFSPDNTRVATAGEDAVTRIWDSKTGTKIAECRGHRSKVLSVAYRPDGKRLMTTSADGSVRQWDPATGREVEPPYERHTGEVMSAAYSPDGQWIVSGGTDRTIRLWRAADRQEAAVLHGHTAFVKEVDFDADGRRIVSVSSNFGSQGYEGDSTVRLWDGLGGADLPVLHGHTSYVYPVAYSPDGQWIASGSWDTTVRLWDAQTGEHCATFSHGGVVRALAFSSDSSWLVSACDADERLQVWDVATGQRRSEIQGTGKPALAVAISPDRTQVAAADRDGALSVSDLATGQNVALLRGRGIWRAKTALIYSPDGQTLASTGDELETIDLWDAKAHERRGQLTGHTGPVYSVAFNSDGSKLVSASSDHTVRVWDVAARKCVALLQGHTDEVFTAAFHPDGTRLASAGRDRAIWLWDLATGHDVARLPGHTNYVFSLAFSPDGKSLISGSGDGTVRLWDAEPLTKRYEARRSAAALRPEAERLVDRLFREKNEATAVVAALRDDGALRQPLRHAALRAVLRRRHE
jgi:WD40 repeat protein/serine/threonine protein kinase